MYSRNIDDIETILKETKPFDGETKAEIFHKEISNFLIDIAVIQVGSYPWTIISLRVGLESDPTIQVYSFDSPVTALVEFKPNFYDYGFILII